MRILLIEDDQSLGKVLSLALGEHGMTVDHVVSGEEALEMIALYEYQTVVLDLGLPDIQGEKVLSHLRSNRQQVPVLVMSAREDLESRLFCLNGGADDFLVKPFDTNEIIARIKALVRRANGHAQSSFQVGEITVDLSKCDVTAKSGNLEITNKEYKILEILCLRHGGVVSKDNLLNHLYDGMDDPDAKIIDVFMCNLRKKFKNAGIQAPIIETLWGRGYRIHPNALEASED